VATDNRRRANDIAGALYQSGTLVMLAFVALVAPMWPVLSLLGLARSSAAVLAKLSGATFPAVAGEIRMLRDFQYE
jgi:hypothetical protein